MKGTFTTGVRSSLSVVPPPQQLAFDGCCNYLVQVREGLMDILNFMPFVVPLAYAVKVGLAK